MFGVIGLLIVVTAYSALNLENRSDVSLGFYTFRSVPVFLTSLIALIMGTVLVVPLTFRKGGRRKSAVPGDGGNGSNGGDDDARMAAEPLPAEPDSTQPDAIPQTEADGRGEDEEPKEASRRRRRWPFGTRQRDQTSQDQDPDNARARDRDAFGGG